MADVQPTSDQYADEQWKPIPGWERLYEVSDHGGARSLERMTASGVVARGRILRPWTSNASGHLKITMRSGARRDDKFVHRLVLESFVGPCPEGMEACHNNGDPTDNRLNNLRWDTHSENMYDRRRHGTDHEVNKTRCKFGHPLEVPNLDKSGIDDGRRRCLACSRARSYIHGGHGEREDFQIIADEYLRRVMSGDLLRSSEKTHCPRNHPLAEPNLVPAHWRKGVRSCLACARARGYLRRHEDLKPHFKRVADSYYEEIMRDAHPPAA